MQKQINNDVTPDYHHTLGNSYARNSQVAFGSTLFFDRGYVGISIDAKDSEYGVPGFSMQNLSFGSNYANGLPVGVVIKQERYALEALLRDPLPWFERAELRVPSWTTPRASGSVPPAPTTTISRAPRPSCCSAISASVRSAACWVQPPVA